MACAARAQSASTEISAYRIARKLAYCRRFLQPMKLNSPTLGSDFMPMINGRYYMNPGYGRALERARLAEAFRDTRTADASDEDESWTNDAINYFTQPQQVSP